MAAIWHLGLAVPDLRAGMAELAELFDLRWRPVVAQKFDLTDRHGQPCHIEREVAYSVDGPFVLEVWQSIPDTPLAARGDSWLHHLGYWATDPANEGQRLAALGYEALLRRGDEVLLCEGPGGILLEPNDPGRDIPHLRDLLPR
jgi:hypothetical protein